MIRQSSYLSPKLEARPFIEGQLGVFAREFIAAGELISVWGGDAITKEEWEQVSLDIRHLCIQVEEDVYLMSYDPSPGDRINHSCDPNAWLEGHIVLRACRDIQPGEHVCFDYATADGSPYDEFECQCGSPICRKHVTGDDWKLPELQARYAGHFMPYLQRRIDALRAAEGVPAQEERRRIIRLPKPKAVAANVRGGGRPFVQRRADSRKR